MQAKILLVVLLILMGAPALVPAGDREETVKSEEAPSLELLEFLGDWETPEGQWVDPADLEEMPVSEVENDDESAN